MRARKNFVQTPLQKKWSEKKTRTGLPLYLEITLILVFKVIVLTIIWKFCFSHPQTKDMTLPQTQVEQHFLNSPHADQSL